MVCISSDTPLGKRVSPSQLSVGDGFWVRNRASPLSAEAHLAKTHVDPWHAATVSVSSCLCQSHCVRRVFFPWGHLSFLPRMIFLFLLYSPKERDLIEISHLIPSVPMSLILCTLSRCGSLYLLASPIGGSTSGDG